MSHICQAKRVHGMIAILRFGYGHCQECGVVLGWSTEIEHIDWKNCMHGMQLVQGKLKMMQLL